MSADEQLEELSSQIDFLRTNFLFKKVDEEELLRFYLESTAKLNAVIDVLVILARNQTSVGSLEDSKKRFELSRKKHLVKSLKKRITKSAGLSYRPVNREGTI
jgi:hypothetical protein